MAAISCSTGSRERWAGRDFVGLTDADLLPADMAQRSEQQDREVLAGGEPMTFHDEFSASDGRPRAFVTTKFPLPGPDGETEAVGVSRPT